MTSYNEMPEQFRFTPEEMEKLAKYGPEIMRALSLRRWWPQPAQLKVLNSPADVLLYAGGAGSGKSNLICGLATTEHQNSIIFRREGPQLAGIIDELAQLLGDSSGFNKKDNRWYTDDGRIIDLGSCPNEEDVSRYQGRPHDGIFLDEICHFTPTQFKFLMGWLRTTDPNQRCRVVCTGNPPTRPEERWVLDYWAPWLAKNHPNPAKEGELRFFAMVDGREVERPNGQPFDDGKGNIVRPLSRTFIRGRLADNEYLMRSGYRNQLESLHEPLRSALLYGDFHALTTDSELQLLPTAWVEKAMARWNPDGHNNQEMTHVGIDVSRGGSDASIIACRHGWWFAPLVEVTGEETSTGGRLAQKILEIIEGNQPKIAIDGNGVGASVHDALLPWVPDAEAILGQAVPKEKADNTGILSFANMRAWMFWRLRTLLDPETGISSLALPPDEQLLRDLTSISYEQTARGILIQSKDELRKKLGRSTDRADAVAYACAILGSSTVHHRVKRTTDRFYSGRW